MSEADLLCACIVNAMGPLDRAARLGTCPRGVYAALGELMIALKSVRERGGEC